MKFLVMSRGHGAMTAMTTELPVSQEVVKDFYREVETYGSYVFFRALGDLELTDIPKPVFLYNFEKQQGAWSMYSIKHFLYYLEHRKALPNQEATQLQEQELAALA